MRLPLDGQIGCFRGGLVHLELDVGVDDRGPLGDSHAIEAHADRLLTSSLDQLEIAAGEIYGPVGFLFRII